MDNYKYIIYYESNYTKAVFEKFKIKLKEDNPQIDLNEILFLPNNCHFTYIPQNDWPQG